MRLYDKNIQLDFSDVLIVPQRSEVNSRKEVNLVTKYKTCNSQVELECCPIMIANMDCCGTIAVAREATKHNIITCLHKHYPLKTIANYFRSIQFDDDSIETEIKCKKGATEHLIWYSMGLRREDIKKYDELIYLGITPQYICVDVANGHMEQLADFIVKLRYKNRTATIMAGNVATPEQTKKLLNCGADIVKVGIGSGKVCNTRRMTGVGYPQLSCIDKCVNIATKMGGLICSDGGIRSPGDACKAFAAGANFVMMGSYFAGTNEAVEENKSEQLPMHESTLMVQIHGMASKEAVEKHYGPKFDYKASEGISTYVPRSGPLSDVINELKGGLRSCCSYVGAKSLQDLSNHTYFIRVNQSHR